MREHTWVHERQQLLPALSSRSSLITVSITALSSGLATAPPLTPSPAREKGIFSIASQPTDTMQGFLCRDLARAAHHDGAGGSNKPGFLGCTLTLCSQPSLCGSAVTSICGKISTVLLATETSLVKQRRRCPFLSIRRRHPFRLPSQEDR